MIKQRVSLFTVGEHRVLSSWLDTQPIENIPGELTVDDAMERLGYTELTHYWALEDAVVAGIVLERVQQRLPQWAVVDLDEMHNQRERFARQYKDREARRTVQLIPQHLLTINWADSGPGDSWPVTYYATWVPLYDVYVITASAESPGVFGTAISQSVALGSPMTLPPTQVRLLRQTGMGSTLYGTKPNGNTCLNPA